MLGLPSKPLEIDLANDIIFKGATVLGINGRLMFETWYQCESFLLSGKIKLDKIVTHQIPLDDFERGFKLMQSGDAIKVVMQIPQQ
jgi:threonine 3-dehydrogenase